MEACSDADGILGNVADGARVDGGVIGGPGTGRLRSVEPVAWLKDVLTRLPGHSVYRLDELLAIKGQRCDNVLYLPLGII